MGQGDGYFEDGRRLGRQSTPDLDHELHLRQGPAMLHDGQLVSSVFGAQGPTPADFGAFPHAHRGRVARGCPFAVRRARWRFQLQDPRDPGRGRTRVRPRGGPGGGPVDGPGPTTKAPESRGRRPAFPDAQGQDPWADYNVRRRPRSSKDSYALRHPPRNTKGLGRSAWATKRTDLPFPRPGPETTPTTRACQGAVQLRRTVRRARWPKLDLRPGNSRHQVDPGQTRSPAGAGPRARPPAPSPPIRSRGKRPLTTRVPPTGPRRPPRPQRPSPRPSRAMGLVRASSSSSPVIMSGWKRPDRRGNPLDDARPRFIGRVQLRAQMTHDDGPWPPSLTFTAWSRPPPGGGRFTANAARRPIGFRGAAEQRPRLS